MQLILGRFYRSRGDRKVEVLATGINSVKPCVVGYYDTDGVEITEIRRTYSNGEVYPDRDCKHDVVSVWVEPKYTLHELCVKYANKLKKHSGNYIMAIDDEDVRHVLYWSESIDGKYAGIGCAFPDLPSYTPLLYPQPKNLTVTKEFFCE